MRSQNFYSLKCENGHKTPGSAALLVYDLAKYEPNSILPNISNIGFKGTVSRDRGQAEHMEQ
jgi:hypothetical protein